MLLREGVEGHNTNPAKRIQNLSTIAWQIKTLWTTNDLKGEYCGEDLLGVWNNYYSMILRGEG